MISRKAEGVAGVKEEEKRRRKDGSTCGEDDDDDEELLPADGSSCTYRHVGGT